MRIGHIAMYVNDLEAAREFFENYLGGLAGELYHNPETGFRSYFVRFDDSTQLELMNRPVMEDPEKGLRRTGYTHLAFSTGSIHAVDALTERLRADGARNVHQREDAVQAKHAPANEHGNGKARQQPVPPGFLEHQQIRVVPVVGEHMRNLLTFSFHSRHTTPIYPA